MKVYLFNQDFTKSKVAKFTKKQCERNCIDSKPVQWLENYINTDAIGLDLYIRIHYCPKKFSQT